MKMTKIVHIISRDKWTLGYVNFFKITFPEYEQVFFTQKGKEPLKLVNNKNVVYVSQLSKVVADRENMIILNNADIIILSGVFTGNRFLAVLNLFPSIVNKMYFHFWGGDFYQYRNESKTNNIGTLLIRKLRNRTFRKAAGLVFLINGEYEKFVEILGVTNRCFVAPMPFDPREKKWCEYTKSGGTHSEVRVLLGNSADPSNHHEETLYVLKKYKDENIKIFCPLSYAGTEEYKQKVICLGKELFGDKFVPLLDYMEYESYRNFLSTIDVGIFPHNRQQAMGNIIGLLEMGKKVYIRRDTSMWDSFRSRNWLLYDFCTIEKVDFTEFSYMDEIISKTHIELGEKKVDANISKQFWEKIIVKESFFG